MKNTQGHRRARAQRGVAMVIALLLVVNIGILEAAFVTGTVQGAKAAAIEKARSKTYYAAQAGGHAALKKVDKLINSYLQTTILSASPSGVVTDAQARVTAGDGIGWLVNTVRADTDNDGIKEAVLAIDGDQALFAFNAATDSEDFTYTLDGVSYNYKITFSEKADPVSVGTDKWDFAYAYRIESNGIVGSLSSQVTLNGDFTVRLQKDNFAKFALCTNSQNTPDGTRVWFVARTNFYGPVHTNDRFNFAYNPSGTFQRLATQVETTARFMDNGSETLMNNDHNGIRDVPIFMDGFNRGVPLVSMYPGTSEAAMVTQATGGSTYQNNGVYLPTTTNNGTILKAGIYVKGDCSITMSVNAQGNAVYRITQSGTIKDVTVDAVANKTTVKNLSVNPNTTSTYTGTPKGVAGAGSLIYVSGAVTAFEGTVQKDTELTVASHGDFTITNNVRYAVFTPGIGTPGTAGYVPPTAANPVPNGADPANLLGIVSWAGGVHVAQSAPFNLDIHGTVMATSTNANTGYFQADSYNTGAVKGTATMLGGTITDKYGAFGQMDQSGNPIHGYGRNFVYDERMLQGKSPPYYPTLTTFIAFTNDISDKLVWQGMN